MIYDNPFKLNMRKEHIIHDNFYCFIEAGYNSKEQIGVLLEATKVTLEKNQKRNFKLALVLNKIKSSADHLELLFYVSCEACVLA